MGAAAKRRRLERWAVAPRRSQSSTSKPRGFTMPWETLLCWQMQPSVCKTSLSEIRMVVGGADGVRQGRRLVRTAGVGLFVLFSWRMCGNECLGLSDQISHRGPDENPQSRNPEAPTEEQQVLNHPYLNSKPCPQFQQSPTNKLKIALNYKNVNIIHNKYLTQ